MSHSGDYARVVSKGTGAPPPPAPAPAPAVVEAPPPSISSAAAVATQTEAPAAAVVSAEPPPRPLDWHGTRRATRVRVRSGVEIQLDGNPAQVVDLSQVGAQVSHTGAASQQPPRR